MSNIILRGYNSVPDEEQSVLPNLQSIILQGGARRRLYTREVAYNSSHPFSSGTGLEDLITSSKDEGEEPLVIIEAEL